MASSTPKQTIIIGSGLAGLSAATQLLSQPSTKNHAVTVLERFPKPGGNSMKASSGINGAPTEYQPKPPTEKEDIWFLPDTIKSCGKAYSTQTAQREPLVKTLVEDSASAVEWLTKTHSIDLSVVAQLGGHSFPRTHRGAGQTPPGASIVLTLLKALKLNPLFKLETECVVTKVLTSTSGAVTGVSYTCADGTPKEIFGPVIFASGGFAGDAFGLLAKYRPDLTGIPSTNDPRPGSQPLLTAIGAQLIDMSEVQVHPTSFIDPKDPFSPQKFLAAELLRGEGGILLHDGKRFIDEMETRKNVTDAISKFPVQKGEKGERQWDVELVLDEATYLASKSHMDFYIWKGLIRKTTISELPEGAIESIKSYSAAAAGTTKDSLKRKSFGHWGLKPEDVKKDTEIYVGKVTPAIHFTMGGVLINKDAQVLNGEGKVIEGVWAAGEVTGGVHGENRLGGSSLLECVVFGRRAGKGAGSLFA